MCLCCWLVAHLSPTHCHPMICKPTSLLWPWGFPRQEYWSRLPCSPKRGLCDPKLEFVSGLLWLLYCSQILYQGAKIYLGYMTHTMNLKILSWWKGKMVKTKHLYLPTNNRKILHFNLPLFILQFISSLKDNCCLEFSYFVTDFNMTVFLNSISLQYHLTLCKQFLSIFLTNRYLLKINSQILCSYENTYFSMFEG